MKQKFYKPAWPYWAMPLSLKKPNVTLDTAGIRYIQFPRSFPIDSYSTKLNKNNNNALIYIAQISQQVSVTLYNQK